MPPAAKVTGLKVNALTAKQIAVRFIVNSNPYFMAL
jgi:hypothetical protein